MSIYPRTVPILSVDYYLVTSKEAATEFIRDTSADVDADLEQINRTVGASLVVMDREGRSHRMLCVFDGTLNTAVHESTHMARIILDWCSIRWTKAHDEPLAYLVAWLADEMMETIYAEGGSAA